MTKNELETLYFEWMYQLVCDEKDSNGPSYRKLLRYLHGTEFVFTIPMDDNRAADGMDLRYRFGYENSYEPVIIANFLDDRPCSVLEMLVALAMRCEEHIMDDPDIGNRTSRWFWIMVSNLGLSRMDDQRYNVDHTEAAVTRFLNREYRRDGKGGLFMIPNCKYDLRNVEIWYQMCWYLRDIL